MKKILILLSIIIAFVIFNKADFSVYKDESNLKQLSHNIDKSYTVVANDSAVNIKNFDLNLKAFPSAEGAGAYTTGGRGGRVFVVNNLNDKGKGSFRDAVEASMPRIVVFSVSGIINNASPLTIRSGNLTIAGQTAPTGGITISGERFVVDGADNTIIRYIKVRPKWSENDAFSVLNTSNFIADHLSVSFGGDEAFTVRGGREKVEFVTVQRTLFSNSKTGSIQGDSDTFDYADNFSFHHNLFYNISHRFPNIGGNGKFEIINNVVHNWKNRLTRGNGSFRLNHINNYYQRGQLSKKNIKELLNKYSYDEGCKPSIYTTGNLVMPTVHTNTDSDNWYMWQWFLDVDQGKYKGAKRNSPLTKDYRSLTCFPALGSSITIHETHVAFINIVGNIGANARLDEMGNKILDQDSLDSEYLHNVKNNIGVSYSGKLAYDDTISEPSYGVPYLDSDNDGMPDKWEIANGFNPSLNDSGNDFDNDGYTNIEEFLNLIDY
jgi:hypothetical protein